MAIDVVSFKAKAVLLFESDASWKPPQNWSSMSSLKPRVVGQSSVKCAKAEGAIVAARSSRWRRWNIVGQTERLGG